MGNIAGSAFGALKRITICEMINATNSAKGTVNEVSFTSFVLLSASIANSKMTSGAPKMSNASSRFLRFTEPPHVYADQGRACKRQLVRER